MFLILVILCKWKKAVSTLKDIFWSKMTPRILTVLLETKVMPSRVNIWLDTTFVKEELCRLSTSQRSCLGESVQ